MISVLYVDDERLLLDLGKLYLERSGGIRVDTLESAKKALDLIRITKYDAVISDFQMPEMDGILFLKRIRAEFPDLPFIIFTGRGREEIVIEALNAGADHYLQKGGDPASQFAELRHNLERAVERKRAHDTIVHLSRLNAVLTSTNRAVVRIHERQALLNEACRIAVDEGKFLMAWIGMTDPATETVVPVAACGYENGYLSNLSIHLDNIPRSMGLSGTAMRQGTTIISNDIASDIRMAHYCDSAEKRGYRSSAAVPIRCHGEITGVMRFYSSEKNFFSGQEIQLLDDLVADIGFALDRAGPGKNTRTGIVRSAHQYE